jgi:hypothetical protein
MARGDTLSHDDIRQVVKLLNATGAAYWLVGGVAIELLVGHAIRLHDDIDVFMKQHQLQRCIDYFTDAGFAVVPGTLGAAGVFLQQGDLLVDFTKVQVDADGSFRTFGIYATIPWPGGLLEPHVIDVAGEVCRTLSAANHLRMKRVVAAWFAGGQMRNKDFQDVRWLETLV